MEYGVIEMGSASLRNDRTVDTSHLEVIYYLM